MPCSPAREAWHKPAAGKGIRRCHAKGLAFAVTLHSGDRRGKCFESVANNRKKARTRISHGHWAWSATEQRAAAITFEQSDLMADCGWRDAEFGGGFLETQVPSSGFESAQLDERRQLFHGPALDENNSS